MRGNETRFNIYREGITRNEETDSNEEESSTSNDSSSVEEESEEDSGDNGTDEKDDTEQQNVIEETTNIKVESETVELTEIRQELMISIADMSINTNTITLKTVHSNSFRKETIKTRIFIL